MQCKCDQFQVKVMFALFQKTLIFKYILVYIAFVKYTL